MSDLHAADEAQTRSAATQKQQQQQEGEEEMFQLELGSTEETSRVAAACSLYGLKLGPMVPLDAASQVSCCRAAPALNSSCSVACLAGGML